MDQQNNLNLVFNACVELNEQNKKPSVGLLRAKLPKNIQLPTIIKGLTQWRENPTRIAVKQSVKKNAKSLDLNARVKSLEKRVEELEQVIKALQT